MPTPDYRQGMDPAAPPEPQTAIARRFAASELDLDALAEALYELLQDPGELQDGPEIPPPADLLSRPSRVTHVVEALEGS